MVKAGRQMIFYFMNEPVRSLSVQCFRKEDAFYKTVDFFVRKSMVIVQTADRHSAGGSVFISSLAAGFTVCFITVKAGKLFEIDFPFVFGF